MNTKGKRGTLNKSITVNTNDPKHSTIVLRLSGKVEMPTTSTTPAAKPKTDAKSPMLPKNKPAGPRNQ